MVRPSRRKGIEEVYGSKMDSIHPAKSMVVSHVGMTKTAALRAERAAAGVGGAGGGGGAGAGVSGTMSNRQMETRTQRSFVTENDYYITTNLPLTAANLRNTSQITQPSASQMMPGHGHHQPSPYNAISSRRNSMANKASARHSQMSKVPHFSLPENKVNNSVYSLAKPKDSHRMHGHGKGVSQRAAFGLEDNMDFSDKELMAPASNQGNTRRQHSHVHQMQPIIMQHSHAHPPQHQLHQQQMSHISSMKHQPQLQAQHQSQQIHQHHHQHQTHHHPNSHQKHSRGRQPNPTSKVQVSTADDEDEKDDDPEEFFELIRQTVQTAVGNTISDTLGKNFRDLGHKIDRFSGELKQTNDHLDKLQEQVTEKVIYYGEENMRHFKYLCMKSEYDKMFYQHQHMMTGKPTPEMVDTSQMNLAASASVANNLGYKTSQVSKHTTGKSTKIKRDSKTATNVVTKKALMEALKVGPFHSTAKSHPAHQEMAPPSAMADAQKSSSEMSLNVKSSEQGMREILGHIQRFCTQMEMKDHSGQAMNLDDLMVPKKLSNSGIGDTSAKTTGRNIAGCQGDKKAEETELDTPVDSMDETYTEMDEFQFSSEISSCSDEDDCMKYGAGDVTTRAPAKPVRRPVNKGAGDGQ